jgi:hypothetical protein
MKETALKIFVMSLVLIVLTLSLILVVSAINETSSEIGTNYTWTKAVCNSSNLCQDYLIECKNKSVVSMSPITGAVVKFSDNWHDPRPQETINKIC